MNLDLQPTLDQLCQLIASVDDDQDSHILFVTKRGDVHLSVFRSDTADGADYAHEDTLQFVLDTFLIGQGYAGQRATQDPEWMNYFQNSRHTGQRKQRASPGNQVRHPLQISFLTPVNLMNHNLMPVNLALISVFALLMLSGSGYGQTQKPAVNFLGIQGPISLQKNNYRLTWSAHPDASLYKQEYLTAGDGFPKYKSMVTIDFILTGSTVDQAADTKLRELETLKRTNPIVQYTIISNAATGEKIIVCLIGNNAANEQDNLVERDVFRFKAIKTKSGQHGILLFMVSTRKYGPDITPFLTRLKADKPVLVNEVAKLTLPAIQL